MEQIYDELTRGGQNRYNGIRRKIQYFSTFAGGVIEALRESGFRLCSFEKQPRADGSGNIELFFEQQDRDQCTVLIVPYRQDLPFLARGRFVAQLGLELSRFCNDPDTLRQAVAVNARASVGTLLGGRRLPKLYLNSPPDLKPPGTMTFELRGARLVVAINVLANLGKYRLSDFELDIDAIREDFQVYFYGLEKSLNLMLAAFGPGKESQPQAIPSQEAPSAAAPGHPAEAQTLPADPPPTYYDLPEALPPGNTIRLDQMPPP